MILEEHFFLVIFGYLTKFHCLVVFTSWDIGQYVSCNCLFTRLWRHKFWNQPDLSNKATFSTWLKIQEKYLKIFSCNFNSPQVKWNLISSTEHFVYELPNELRYDLKKMKRNKKKILKLDEDGNILAKALFTSIQSTRVHHHLKHAWNSTRIHLKTVHQAILVETVKSCSLNLSLLPEVYCSQTVICNIPIESANRCKILPRPAVSSGLTVVKLERDLKYTDHVSLEPVHPLIAYHALTYLKSYNKFS